MAVILDPGAPEVRQFLDAISRLNTNNWLTVCDRFVSAGAEAGAAAAPADAATAVIRGNDLHISEAERESRLQRIRPAYDKVEDIVASLPETISRNNDRFPLRGLARSAALNCLRGISAEGDLRNRPNGMQLVRALTSPFDGMASGLK